MIARKFITPVLAGSLVALMTVSAVATEGYFQHGYGARQKALGGAGVADSTDATAQALNPAGIARVGNQINAAISLFAPTREFTGTGFFGFTPLGNYESSGDYFAIPNFAISYALDEDSAIGFMMIGNGGMNTTWKGINRNLTSGPCPVPPLAPAGVYCMGKAGVDLNQMIMGVTYARALGNVSYGVTPLFAIQRFSSRGLTAFRGISLSPNNLTDRGNDYAYGVGLRAGLEFDVTPNMRVAIAAQTPIWSTKFKKYSGLFADGGSFDIPGNVTVGFAYDITDTVTVMADWRHIFYSGVGAISNPSTNAIGCAFAGGGPSGSPLCLGGSNGTGFGWRDVDAFKIGVEWDATEDLTVRLGYAFNTQPIRSRDVMFNILAPGVTQHHITGGFKYDINDKHSIELAAAYMPATSVSGPELPFPLGAGPLHNIDLSMSQVDVTLGYTYRWGGAKAEDPIMRKY